MLGLGREEEAVADRFVSRSAKLGGCWAKLKVPRSVMKISSEPPSLPPSFLGLQEEKEKQRKAMKMDRIRIWLGMNPPSSNLLGRPHHLALLLRG